jgi:hypothetical protein
MKYLSLLLFFTVLLPVSLPVVHADTLLVDKIGNERSSDSEFRAPDRGQSMELVRRNFGEPDSILSAVGDPPITRWVYERFTVYFEYQLVITSVINH